MRLMARKTFEEVGYFDDSMRRVEDADFAIRLILSVELLSELGKLGLSNWRLMRRINPEKNLEAEVLPAQKNKGYLEALELYYYGNNGQGSAIFILKGNIRSLSNVCRDYLFVSNPIPTASCGDRSRPAFT